MGTDKQFVKSRIRHYAQAAFMLGAIYGGFLIYNGSAGRFADKIEASVSNVWNNWLNVHLGYKCKSLTEDEWNNKIVRYGEGHPKLLEHCEECSFRPVSVGQKAMTTVFRVYLLAILVACAARITCLKNMSKPELKQKGYKGTSKDFYVMADLIRRCDGFRVWMLLFSPILLTMDLYYGIAGSIAGVLNAKISFAAIKKVVQKSKERWDKPNTWRPLPKKLKSVSHSNPSWWKLPPLPYKLESVFNKRSRHPLSCYADPLLINIFDREGLPLTRQIFSYAGHLYCTDGIIAARVPVKSNPFPTTDHTLIRLAHLFDDKEYEMPIFHLTSIAMSSHDCSMTPIYHDMIVKNGLVWAQMNRKDWLFRCSAGGHASNEELQRQAIVAAWHEGDPEPGHDALMKACAK